MPTPDHTNGAPCWIDLMTSDAEKAKAFYGELFGWTFETGDQEKYGGYITACEGREARRRHHAEARRPGRLAGRVVHLPAHR